MTGTRLLENGQKIVFVGDSITEAPDGYVRVFEQMLAALAPDLRIGCINAGVSGNKVGDVLERIGDDVIAHDPDWITVSIGINDVWHGVNGTPIAFFKERYEELVERLTNQTVAKLALFTTTLIGEDLESEGNRRLVEYNDFIRETAIKRQIMLVPMNEEFHKAVFAWHKMGSELRFTTDGVHMLAEGNYLMSLTLLRAFGFI